MPLRELGVEAPARARLVAYLDTLAAWSTRTNLTGARGPAERVALLVAPVLPAAPYVLPGRLLDVGSGNGSPGLVLALLGERNDVVLLEPRARRWAFLREAARAAGVADRVDVRRERHDAYRGAPARTLALRALALPLAELAPLVDPGGRVLVFGGSPCREGPFEDEPLPGAPVDLHAFRRR